MKLFQKRATPTGSADFALLRTRLEVEVARPAVIALTSSTIKDGKEIAARELARSLAATGYSTLFVDASLTGRGLSAPLRGLTLEEVARLQTTPDTRTGSLATLALCDVTLQKSANHRGVQSTFQTLRAKFDYVVVSLECGVSTSFATAIVTAADAVLVTVKMGRRQTADDARLSEVLERCGSRFIGVVALDTSIMLDDQAPTPVSDAIFSGFRSQTVTGDHELHRRDIAKSTT